MALSERVFTGPHPDQGRCDLPAGAGAPSSGERAGTNARALLASVLLSAMSSRA